MAEPIPTAASSDSNARSRECGNETGLRAEIAFWREMLDTCGENTPSESRERMGFALALAEKRLQALFEDYSLPGNAGECPPNVFHLNRKRR